MGSRVFRNTAVATPSLNNIGAARKIGGAMDLPLLLVMLAILTFGLVMVFSASWDFSLIVYDDPMTMFFRQALWLALGCAAAYVLSRIDYHYWRRLIVPAMLGTLVLLAVVLFFNEVRLGAVRALLNGSVQPSEIAKVVTVIYLAVWLNSKREQLHDVTWGLLPLAAILGLIGGLIYLQPDLSATATVFMLGGLLFFLAGGDLKQILFLFVVALVVGTLVVQVSATGRERLSAFFMGLQDPLQASYHVRRSLEAIVKGGWFGVGLGRADTKYIGLPVPPTDSIFAVIVEELGILGGIVTLLLYAAFIWRGLRIAQKAPDMLGSMLASGLTFWIAVEAIINVLVIVGLMPFAGNALPFISAGGSSLTASLIAVGILLNVSRQAEAGNEHQDWRNFGAVLDLRGRNRRRSVSRPVRSGSSEE